MSKGQTSLQTQCLRAWALHHRPPPFGFQGPKKRFLPMQNFPKRVRKVMVILLRATQQQWLLSLGVCNVIHVSSKKETLSTKFLFGSLHHPDSC